VTVLAEIVDGKALVEMLWTAAAAGLGVTVAFAVALVGATRAVDLRRDGHVVEAGAYAVVGVVGLAVVAGAIVLGIVAMTSK
jgi:hypothetical protein